MFKQLGAIYIILGTCIAAGLLGLPIVTANGNYLLSTLMVISAWCLMTTGAWCLMKVNLWFPPQSNLISMSEATLGKPGKYLTWVLYLLLLYSLICAYLAGSSDVIHALLNALHIPISRSFATLIAMLSIGAIIYHGIKSVDLFNRLLMSIKLVICLTLIVLVIPHAHFQPLLQGSHAWHGSVWLVIICAFGYAIIIPSIRDYLDSNEKQLKRVVLIGSLVPLLLYLIWIAVIQGAINRYGAQGLIAMNGSANTNSLLMQQLIHLTHQPFLSSISVIFISICSITGLLGVGLCMTDFLADGLQQKKEGLKKFLLVALALMPSAVIILFDPALFISALAYAGLCCLYILVGLPIAMYWRGKCLSLDQR